MRVVVTGGLGFIGSAITERLLSLGHEVKVIDNFSSPSNRPLPVSIVDGAIRTDVGDYDSLLKVKYTLIGTLTYPDVVIHTAAMARTVPCVDNPLFCHRVNATGSLNVFQILGKARIVHCSSNVVLGVPTPYRASKLAAEHYLEAYNALYNANIIGLRFSNVLGPHLRKGDGAVLSMLRDSRGDKGYVEVTGDGTQTRNFCFVDDIVDACMLAAFDSTHRGILDITTGISTSMNEFASYFNCPIRYIEDRKGDSKHLIQSPEEAERVLGWKYKTPLDEAIRRSLA